MSKGDTGNPSGTKNSEDSKTQDLKLNFGVFFDGTLNSIANIDERKDFKQFLKDAGFTTVMGSLYSINKRIGKILDDDSDYDSYRNEYTNVARFFVCSQKKKEEIIPIYVEGIGTKPREIGKKIDFTESLKDEKKNYKRSSDVQSFIKDNDGFITCSDDQLGSALGIGMFGVKKKVESACNKICKELKSIKKLSKYNKVDISFYVFGFSRGSAAARCFTASLKTRLGTTKVESSFNSNVIGIKNFMSVKNKLKLEDELKYSLKQHWLDCQFNNVYCSGTQKKISFNLKVEFLGLYDTVSSYGSNFDDDIDELALDKYDNVTSKIYQICAGDEYRTNFALTDIKSASNGDYIIIPGAHSDVGGGYAHNMCEKKRGFLWMSSGHKGTDILVREGWFKKGEPLRIISNLYSLIPFNLMKEKIVGLDKMFKPKELKKYELFNSGSRTIDRIKHEYSKDLWDFYSKLKSGTYSSFYKMEGNTIRNLSKQEYDLSNSISNIEYSIQLIDKNAEEFPESFSDDLIENLEKRKETTKEALSDVKNDISAYKSKDLELLKRIRHDFLHLSAKSASMTDCFVNGADTNNNRTVFHA